MAKQIIFCGAGGMYHYYLGLAHVIQKYMKLWGEVDVIWSGISAGCFPALALAAGLDVDVVYDRVNRHILSDISNCRMGALFNYNKYAKARILDYLPLDCYQKVNGKMRISVTHVPSFRNEVIDRWESNEDLVDGIFSSAYVPLFGDHLWKYYRGSKLVDGGISDYYGKKFERDGVDSLYITKDRWRNTKLHWFWCWSNERWADELYLWGLQDGYKHIGEIKDFLGIKNEIPKSIELEEI